MAEKRSALFIVNNQSISPSGNASITALKTRLTKLRFQITSLEDKASISSGLEEYTASLTTSTICMVFVYGPCLSVKSSSFFIAHDADVSTAAKAKSQGTDIETILNLCEEAKPKALLFFIQPLQHPKPPTGTSAGVQELALSVQNAAILSSARWEETVSPSDEPLFPSALQSALDAEDATLMQMIDSLSQSGSAIKVSVKSEFDADMSSFILYPKPKPVAASSSGASSLRTRRWWELFTEAAPLLDVDFVADARNERGNSDLLLFHGTLKTSFGTFPLIADLKKDRQWACFKSIFASRVPMERLPNVAEYLLFVNAPLKTVSFELDPADGDLRLQYSVSMTYIPENQISLAFFQDIIEQMKRVIDVWAGGAKRVEYGEDPKAVVDSIMPKWQAVQKEADRKKPAAAASSSS